VAGFLLADDKRYFVRGQFGQITDTADAEGEVIKTQPFEHLTDEEIRMAVNQFVGDIEQIPPMYSALKKDGQPLYKLARQGIEIDRPPRPVTIHHIDYLGYEQGVVSLEVSCSKGTYIRTLIEDIGNKLGCGAHVIELRRTGFAHIDITQTIKFSDLEKLATDDYQKLDEKIFATQDMLPNFDSVYLDEQQTIDIKYGRSIDFDTPHPFEIIKLFDHHKQFLGVGELNEDGGIKPKRLFI
jgi:tRNA pseudouridine55 synthase